MENKILLNKRIKQQFINLLKDIDMSIAESIVDEFFSNDEHVSATKLKDNLRAKGTKIGLDEIKKALKTFVEYGFAKAHKFEGVEEPNYEHSHLGVHHDHFICTKCGKIIEFEDDEIESLQLRNARRCDFYPLHHKMEIYGLCSECSDKSVKNISLSAVPVGAKVRISSIEDGQGIQNRLSNMGLLSGVGIEVLGNEHGPVIISVGTSRLAISRGMANKVLVTME